MNYLSRSLGYTAVAGVIVSSSLLYAQEHKVTRSQLPQIVAAAIDKEAKGADIKAYIVDRENGKKVYEAETMVNGHTRDIQVAEDGTLNEIEEEVDLSSLPDPVKEALTKRSQGAKIVKVESLTKGGKLVAYEAGLVKGAKKSEVQVGPDGSKLAHPE